MKTTRAHPSRPRASARSGSAPRRPGRAATLQPSQILEITQDAIFLWRDPGGIEFWNRGAAELYGYTEKQALGRAPHELLKTEFPIPLVEVEKELRATGLWAGELHQRGRSGNELIVASRFQLVQQSDRSLLVLESTRDITSQKRNEEKLLRRLEEQAVIARFNTEALEATSVQNICEAATGLVARELKTDFSSIFELSADGATLLLRAGAGWRAGHVGTVRVEAGETTPSGRALHLNQPILIADARRDKHLHLPPVMQEQGVVSSMAVVIHGRARAFGGLSVDTTEPRFFDADDVHFLESIGYILATAISRIQFEHELRDTAARLKGVVSTAADGIVTINETGIVETVNPAAERIFGYSAAEVVGRNISMLMPEPYRSEHDKYLERYRRTGERRIIGVGREVRGRRKDGSEFPMDLAVSATNLGDQRIFTGLVRDITARKQLEEEILKISDHEQRRIGSDLHDDLCQRLAGIRFACDALKGVLPNDRTGGAKKRLEKISAEVSSAIDHTRMLARGLAPVALEANGLVSALEELAQSIARLSGVKCSLQGDKNVMVRDSLAATHLYRIVQEAINNALKHARPSRIVVSLKKCDARIQLAVEDNGKGFSPDASKHAARGMGLRTIAYRAGMINADLKVDSVLGKGTRVTCTFASDL